MTDDKLVSLYVETLLKRGHERYSDSGAAYAYALGNLEGKLGNILMRLKLGYKQDEMYFSLVEGMKIACDIEEE